MVLRLKGTGIDSLEGTLGLVNYGKLSQGPSLLVAKGYLRVARWPCEAGGLDSCERFFI